MSNENVAFTLDEAVAEVLGLLTGSDLTYSPEFERYRVVARALNRALRANALENEWSCYASTEDIGEALPDQTEYYLRPALRPRIIGDDAVRLVDASGNPRVWAYFMTRDAEHKYAGRPGLWVTATGSVLRFSRPISTPGLRIHIPVMREPRMFKLPPPPNETGKYTEDIAAEVREQELDFDYPDVVVARAAYYHAQSDPVLQPRVQTLEADYKNLMYALVERDTRHTDSPFVNDFAVPISGSLHDSGGGWWGSHPHNDERR